MPELLDVWRCTHCDECGGQLDAEQIRLRLRLHGECAEKVIARSAKIFETYKGGGRIEGLFDAVRPP